MRILVSIAALSAFFVPDCQAQLQVQRYGENDVLAFDVDASSMFVTRVDRSTSHHSLRWLELVNGEWQEMEVLDEETSADFGESISISGDWAAVGESVWNDRAGRVRLYRRVDGNWNRVDALALSVNGLRPDEAFFGATVDIDYPWLLVRAPNFRENEWGPSLGAIFFYEHVGGDWVYRMHIAGQNAYGFAISLEEDVAVVGPNIYQLRDDDWVQVKEMEMWTSHCSGSPLSTDGVRVAVVRRALDCQGRLVYLYAPDAHGSWALQDSIVGPLPRDGSWGHRFIDLKGSVLTIEERVYVEAEGGWTEVAALRGSHEVGHVGVAYAHSSTVVVGLKRSLYVFDISRSSTAPLLISPDQSALLDGEDSLVVAFSWQPVEDAEGYVFVAAADGRPQIVEALDADETTHVVTYHLHGEGQSDEQFRVTWQVSALLEDGVGRPAPGSFDVSIETSYVPPPPFGGFDLSRFTPVGVGSRWEYFVTHTNSVGDDETTTTGYESFEILPDTTIHDTTYTVVYIQRFDDERRRTQAVTCAHGVKRLRLDAAIGDAECEWLYILIEADDHVNFLPDQTVEISGIEHEVDAVASHQFIASGPGGGSGGYYHVEWAADIGLVSYGSGSYSSYPPDFVTTRKFFEVELLFARVNGVTYGQSLVKAEPGEQPGSTALAIEALYPNPVDDVLHVRLDTPAPGKAVIDFFDVAGRRVHRASVHLTASSTAFTVELPQGASGLLLVRATDAAGSTASAHLIRITH